jgi:Na+-translocating ferredoxin:NAD+ oxidoreductase subunit B
VTVHRKDIYDKLASLWSGEIYGWLDYLPEDGSFQNVLRELFSEEEAQVLSNIPVKPVPLDFVPLEEIVSCSNLPEGRLESILDTLVARGLLFYRKSADGKKNYSLLKSGYGFSQVFYWKGDQGIQTRRMLELEKEPDYKKAKINMCISGKEATKAWKYIPITESIDPQWQSVYPSATIEKVIMNAKRYALAHCTCRVTYQVRHNENCGHSTEVCIKLDELADCLIESGLAKEIAREEALEIIYKAQKEGLVHFTENTEREIKHICNCCGCACWNVSPIRHRQIPRDVLMATYFIRETLGDKCTACYACAEICPVNAVSIDETEGVKIDSDWCIGCGVCVSRCHSDAIIMREKENKPFMAKDIKELYFSLNRERQARLKTKGDSHK